MEELTEYEKVRSTKSGRQRKGGEYVDGRRSFQYKPKRKPKRRPTRGKRG